MSKFINVPVEDDTTLLVSLESTLGERDVLYQQWYWDGIKAESLIFVGDDVGSLSDEELETEVRSSPLVKAGSLTISRSKSGYTFVNFNFVQPDELDDLDDWIPGKLSEEQQAEKRKKTYASIAKSNQEAVDNIKKKRLV